MRSSCCHCPAVSIETCRSCRKRYCADHGAGRRCDQCRSGEEALPPVAAPIGPCHRCRRPAGGRCERCRRGFCGAHGRAEREQPTDPFGRRSEPVWRYCCNGCRQWDAELAERRRLLPAAFVVAARQAGSPGVERYPLDPAGVVTACWRIGIDGAPATTARGRTADGPVELYLTETLDLCRLRFRPQRGRWGRTRMVPTLRRHLRAEGDTVEDLFRTAAELGLTLDLGAVDLAAGG